MRGHPLILLEPVGEELGPEAELAERRVEMLRLHVGHAGAMGTALEDVELDGDAGSLEGFVEGGGVEGVDRFVAAGGVEKRG